MTKKELTKRIQEFIDLQDDSSKDEWWCTNRYLYDYVLREFAATLGIKLEEPK